MIILDEMRIIGFFIICFVNQSKLKYNVYPSFFILTTTIDYIYCYKLEHGFLCNRILFWIFVSYLITYNILYIINAIMEFSLNTFFYIFLLF